jgi:hypothetical protein
VADVVVMLFAVCKQQSSLLKYRFTSLPHASQFNFLFAYCGRFISLGLYQSILCNPSHANLLGNEEYDKLGGGE